MSDETGPKSTSYGYGRAYQEAQAQKYRERASNHWSIRVQLARDLVGRFVAPRLQGSERKDVVVVDIGCSIGTFALEFARQGYHCFGVDFDPAALEIARELSQEERVDVEFVEADIATWKEGFPPIDIALSFDVFEHLHDDELGGLLQSIRKQLSERGCLVFHTYPTQYGYLFFARPWLRLPLRLIRWLPVRSFERLARAYAALLDVVLLLTRGQTYKERIKRESHCNPLTKERLSEILERAGFETVHLEAAQLYSFESPWEERFSRHPISFANLAGVAVPRSR